MPLPPLARAAFQTLLMLLAASAGAQGTAVVPSGDPAYADLDRLNELGLLESMVVGQRPYSGREFGRLVAIARRRALAANTEDPRERDIVAAAIERLAQRFGPEAVARRPDATLLDAASLVATSTDARRRPLLGNLGAPTEATIDPLADRRLGEPAVRGQTLALEVAQRAEPADWLAVNARERVEVRDPRDPGSSRQHAELLLGGVRVRHGNLALSIGREQFTWAQRPGDGLFLASDAPALDQVSLSSDAPFRLPGLLRVLGPTRGTILLADLGASEVRSHSRLLIYKLSIAPTRTLELGWTFENHFLGAGHRPSSALNQLIDFVPLIDIFRRHNYTDTTRTLDVESDKAVGMDARFVIPSLGGLVVSGEWLIDDFDADRLTALFTNDGSETLALTFPRVGTPAVSLALSAKHMGIFTYTHATLTNGMTTRGRLLGDELGPDAKAFGAVVGWQASSRARVTVDLRTAQYSDVTYSSTYVDPALSRYSIDKQASGPNELRDRVLVGVQVQPAERIALTARAGGERVRNARYYGDRTLYMVELAASVSR